MRSTAPPASEEQPPAGLGEDPGQFHSGKHVTDQIFVVSAAMVGVCLTLMGVLGIVDSLRPVRTLADELLAADAVAFLVACLAAYLSMRTRSTAKRVRYGRFADVTFVGAMVALVVVGGIVAIHVV